VTDELLASLEQNVADGYLEIIGENEKGEPLYSLTARGKAHVAVRLDEAIEQAAKVFAENAGVPLWMARDLILVRALELKELDS
jgi:hypothetical protein